MLKLLIPDLSVSAVTEVYPASLLEKGIRFVLFDLDNTVVPRDRTDLSAGVAEWLSALEQNGIKLCIVSNNSMTRVRRVNGIEKIPVVHRAIKPLKSPFRKAMEVLDASPRETAVIGDQIFTDILGGNRLGLYTILVTPLPGKEYWATSLINRRLERLVLALINRRNSGKGGKG